MSQAEVLDLDSFSHLCQQVAQHQAAPLVKNRPIWIFGAGNFGRDVCVILVQQGFDVQGFIETKPKDKQVLALPVLSWVQLQANHLKAQLVIGIYNRGMPMDELESIPRLAGFTNIVMPWHIYAQFGKQLAWRFWLSAPDVILSHLPAIERVYHTLEDEASRRCLLGLCAFRLGQNNSYASFTHSDHQYFNDLTLGRLAGKKICFVDGGAYNGDSFSELLASTEVSGAYLFEPDPANFKLLAKGLSISAVPAVCLPLALSDQYGILSFNAGHGEGASITENGSSHIAAVSLDEVLATQQVDFIKLDVEGAEVPALRGAKKLIERSRPVLAISLYHRPQDIWEIPALLSLICKDYSFYIRQHYFNSFDSVLYAVPN